MLEMENVIAALIKQLVCWGSGNRKLLYFYPFCLGQNDLQSSKLLQFPNTNTFTYLPISHEWAHGSDLDFSSFLGLHALILSVSSLLQSFIFLLLPLWRLLIGFFWRCDNHAVPCRHFCSQICNDRYEHLLATAQSTSSKLRQHLTRTVQLTQRIHDRMTAWLLYNYKSNN